jgi:DNA-binding response OmpR family regulator
LARLLIFQLSETTNVPETTAVSLSHLRSIPIEAEKPATRILVVDDESLVRWSVSESLRDRGFEVDAAADAQSAICALEQASGPDRAYDLILLDMHLPDSPDLRLLGAIRARSATQPVLVMTAFATREIVEQAAALGAEVVNKPFELDRLAAAVERTLGRVY